MTPTALTTTDRGLTTTDVVTAFGAFLRLYVADGDTSPERIRSYSGNAAQFGAWWGEHGINPATVTEDHIATAVSWRPNTRWVWWPSSWRRSGGCTGQRCGAGCWYCPRSPQPLNNRGEGACCPIGRRRWPRWRERNCIIDYRRFMVR
jgi:hypothetical protein